MSDKEKILIADDSAMNRAILTEMLGDGYELLEAENGRQAVAILQSATDIDLLLLDIMMPEMDGFEVLAMMNKYHWIDEVPVIMISAENASSYVERAYDLGATDYISRPFDMAVVRRRVINTLMLYAKQKRLVRLVAEQVYEKEKSNSTMINILSHIVEFRNGESGMHVLHIQTATDILLHTLVQKTDKYHLTAADISLISTASALHDIGKIVIPEEILNKVMDAAAAHKNGKGADLVGINMEGPFISPSKVGAQNPDYVRNPSAEEFRRLQEAAGGLFKLVDIAPEEPGAEEFIREMANEVRISLAHTCTDYDTAVRAFELGARQLTHLYNAMDPMHHRKPGPIPAAVEHGEVTAEIIADGVHIHPAMVRLAFQLFGDDRMILISDTLRAAGLEDGTYDLGGQDVTVRGPVATIDNGALAGSVSDLMRCLTVAVRDMGIPLASAVKAASANPARALGLDAERGAIEPGKVADAVLLDKETLDVKAVVLRGELLA